MNTSTTAAFLANVTGPRIQTSLDLGVGIFYLLFSLAFLALYVPVLTLLYQDKELRAMPVYKLILADSACDIVQLISFGVVCGLMSILNTEITRPFNIAMGTFSTAGFYVGIMLDCSIAFDRLLIMYSPHLANRLFEGKKCFWWIAFAIVWGCAMQTVFLAYQTSLLYDLESLAFYFGHPSTLDINVVEQANTIYDYTCESFIGACYIAVGVRMISLRNKAAQKLGPKERKAMYQSFCICISLIVDTTVGNVLPLIMPGKSVQIASVATWIMTCGWPCLVLIIFNDSFRNSIFHRGKEILSGGKGTTASNKVSAASVTVDNL